MASGADAKAKMYEALWRSAMQQGSMCADHIKGDVSISFEWKHGPADERTMYSDEAEKLARDCGQSVIVNALSMGFAAVTITARRLPPTE